VQQFAGIIFEYLRMMNVLEKGADTVFPPVTIERIVLLDFIHHLVSQKTNKIEELKI